MYKVKMIIDRSSQDLRSGPKSGTIAIGIRPFRELIHPHPADLDRNSGAPEHFTLVPSWITGTPETICDSNSKLSTNSPRSTKIWEHGAIFGNRMGTITVSTGV